MGMDVDGQDPLKGCVLIASNLPVLLCVYYCCKRKLWLEFFVLLNVFWASSSYHLCDSLKVCWFDYNAHYWIDHFFAFMSFVAIGIYCINFESVERRYFVFMLLAEATILGFVLFGITHGVMFAIMSVVLLMMLFRWIQQKSSRCVGIDAVLASILIFFGLSAFIFLNDDKMRYWYIHSSWHVSIFLAAFFVLQTPAYNVASRMNILPITLQNPSDILLDNQTSCVITSNKFTNNS